MSASSAMPRPVRTSALVRKTIRAARRLDGVSRGTTGSSRSNTTSIGTPSTFSTRAPSRSRVGLTGRRHVHPVRELPETDREPMDGVRVVRRPDAHVAVAAVRADHGDQVHHPDQHLVVVQVGIASISSPAARSNVASGTPWNRSGWMSSICSTRDVTSAVHRSTRVSAAGDALDRRRARGRDRCVRRRAGSGREDEPGDDGHRSVPGAAIGDVRIVRNRTRYYGSVVAMIRSC